MPGKGGKKAFIAKEKAVKSRAKKETVEDMNQNYDINQLKKSVKELTKATKGFSSSASDSSTISTIVGTPGSTSLAFFQVGGGNTGQPSDIIGANKIPGTLSGRFFTIKHLDFRYSLDMDPDSDVDTQGASVIVRVMLLAINKMYGEPSDNAGALFPNLNDILSLASGNMTSSDVMAPYTRLLRSNFEVLHDEFHVLSPEANSGNAGNGQAGTGRPFTSVNIRHLHPQKRFQQVTLNDETVPISTVGANIAENAYIVVALSDHPTGTPNPTITFNYVVDYLE